MPSLATKERKAKFNTGDLIFRKESNLPSGTLLSAEYNSAESLTNFSELNQNKQLIFQIYQKNLFL